MMAAQSLNLLQPGHHPGLHSLLPVTNQFCQENLPFSTSKTSPDSVGTLLHRCQDSHRTFITSSLGSCSGETSKSLDRLHPHSLPSSLAPNEISPTKSNIPLYPLAPQYLFALLYQHAPSQSMWSSIVYLVSTSHTS